MKDPFDAREAIANWFGLSRRVTRTQYATAGLVLMAVKYLGELWLLRTFTGGVLTPLEFLNPLLAAREAMLAPAPSWLPWLLYLWTLPFLWVAVSMSIRRAADAGGSPWLGFLVLVPILNLCLMMILCCWPSAAGERWQAARPTNGSAEEPRWHASMSVALGVLLG